MSATELLTGFMIRVKDDPRISTAHISLYMSLLTLWVERSCTHPFSLFSYEVTPYCKISGPATYHKCIRQLAEYGYIKYVPSHNNLLGSLVYLWL